jgi:hypothetical protein
MSQSNYTEQKEVSISQSMMTFKDYYISFISSKEHSLTNDWGWFVDIEKNSETIKNKYYFKSKFKSSRFIAVPQTIKEHGSIRSMKSMDNLQEPELIFEMEEEEYKHRTNKVKFSKCIYCNLIGILTIGIIYYTMFII